MRVIIAYPSGIRIEVVIRFQSISDVNWQRLFHNTWYYMFKSTICFNHFVTNEKNNKYL